jgi:integral membrane protein (TIGR01906 family)
MNALTITLRLLFLLCITILLITTNARWAINDIRLYEYEFNRYGISQDTGLEKEQLLYVGKQIQDYFNAVDTTPLDVRLSSQNGELDLFTQTEVLHMHDVKELVRTTYRVQEGALLYLILFSLMGLLTKGKPFLRILLQGTRLGSVMVLAIVAIASILSSVAFSQIFYLFHLAGFRNVLWQLDPTKHYLIRIFPEGFFFDFTLFIGGASALEAIALLVLTWAWSRYVRIREDRRVAAAPYLS